MFVRLMRYEAANIVRERLTLLMLIWPPLLAVICRYLINEGILVGDVAAMLAAMLVMIVGYVNGAMTAFSLLDDRDDMVFISIAITPVPLPAYVLLKVGFGYIIAVLSTVASIAIIGVPVNAMQAAAIALVSALQVPIASLLINALAKNKVEGFAVMKGVGFIVLFPLAAWFFTNWKAWLFCVAPGYWPVKALQALYNGAADVSFGVYMTAGATACALLAAGMFHLFLRKTAV